MDQFLLYEAFEENGKKNGYQLEKKTKIKAKLFTLNFRNKFIS